MPTYGRSHIFVVTSDFLSALRKCHTSTKANNPFFRYLNGISIQMKWSIIKVLHFVYLLFDIIIMTLEKWVVRVGLLTITWVYILTADALRSNWQWANPITFKSKYIGQKQKKRLNKRESRNDWYWLKVKWEKINGIFRRPSSIYWERIKFAISLISPFYRNCQEREDIFIKNTK